MSFDPGKFNSSSVSILISGCVLIFLAEGSFKGSGVLYGEAVRIYTTTNISTGWVFSFQLSVAFLVAGVGGAAFTGFSNRAMGVIGGFLFGLGFAGIGIFRSTFWIFVALHGVAAFGNGLISFACYMSFYENFGGDFALCNSIRHIFAYVGITLMPPIIDLLRSNFGFYGSYLLLGAIFWNSVICGVLFKNKTEGISNGSNFSEEGNTVERKGNRFGGNGCTSILMSFFDVSAAREHPHFALFVMIDTILFHNFAVWAIFLVSFGTSAGLKPEEAVFLSTAGGIGGCIAKITVVATFYINLMNALTSTLVPAIIGNVGLLGYIWSKNKVTLLVCSFLCGFSFAFTESALSGMVPKYVCNLHFRQGSKLFYITDGIFMQLGCIAAGAILDLTSSFAIMFAVLLFTNIVMCILAIALHVTYKPVNECKP